MYTLGVRRDFIARHFLIGGDWGPENFPNSHHYILELQLEGRELDQHGYLVDIVDVEKHLDEIVDYYNVFRRMKKALRDYAAGPAGDDEMPVHEKKELFTLLDKAERI